MEAAAKRIPLSLGVVGALWAVLAFGLFTAPPANILSWDTLGYHLYLPATFLHHDPAVHDPAWIHRAVDTYHGTGTIYQAGQLPDGRWIMKYPMGLAVLWAPFFICGHLAAGVLGYPADGFSAPYQWTLIISALVYVLMGLLVLRRVLLLFFAEVITAATLTLIVMGTNYFHQVLNSTGMPHLFLFTLGAGVLLHTVRWHQDHQRRDAIFLGALLGLLLLARPSEIVWVLIPLLFGITGPGGWRAHFKLLWRWRAHLILAAGMVLLVVAPQLCYWKWMTGKWLYMSYNNPGEGFEFLHPYTWEVLFSFRKGWFIYTPLMLLAASAIWLLPRHLGSWQRAVAAFFVLNLFIVSSWSCWWYADSFGQRALVQSYPVMAIPLGALLLALQERGRRWVIAGVGLLVVLVGLNLFQTDQSVHGLIHTSRMTWPAYKAVFGRTEAPQNLESLFSVARAYDGQNGSPDPSRYIRTHIVSQQFEGPTAEGRIDPVGYGESGGFSLRQGLEFTPALRIPWQRLTASDHAWFEVSCRIMRPTDGSKPAVSLITTMEHDGESYGYAGHDVGFDQVAPGEWTELRCWYLSPEVRRPEDMLAVYIWLRDNLPVVVDDVEVYMHEPRPKPER